MPVNICSLPLVVAFMEVWKKILGYLTFRKPDPDAPTNFNLRVMHGINKISLFMFLIALVLLIVKLAT
ncbi:MAG: hypothetical protein D6722_11690 [Bacteroidetes bacterium]|nr:MAG: hypothetical protein D6722_11690 [Bacteroidota bacterium]